MVEAGTDMSQDTTRIATTQSAGTQTQATSDVALAAGSTIRDAADAADANLLLDQLQHQLEEQLAHEQATATEKKTQASHAGEVELDLVAKEVISSVANEALSESSADSSLLSK